MTYNHLKAVLFTFILYALLFLSFWGWGKLLDFILNRKATTRTTIPNTYFAWAGWSIFLLLLQVAHFFIAIRSVPVIFILLIGIVFSILFCPRNITSNPSLHSKYIYLAATVFFVLLSGWIASRSMLSPTNYDSGLYHFNTIRWINEYRIVPGLGNLHDRLAFNQSYFTYVAALNFFPFFGYGRSVANSFLYVLTFATLFELLLPLIFKPKQTITISVSLWAIPLLCIPMLAYWGLTNNGLSSPSPDLTSLLLQLIVFIMTARILGNLSDDHSFSVKEAMIVCLLSASAVSVKLSNIVFSTIIILLVVVMGWKHSNSPIKTTTKMLSMPTLVFMVFALRGYILSGAPFFPSTFAHLNTEWAVPKEAAIETRNWVYSWARQPYVNWQVILGHTDWFWPWLLKTLKNTTEVVYPLAIFFVLGLTAITAHIKLKHKVDKAQVYNLLLFFPLFFALIFWFKTAPNPKFANAVFFLLPLPIAIHILELLRFKCNTRAFLITFCIIFLALNFNTITWTYKHKWILKIISTSGWHPTRVVPLNCKTTESGLQVYVPVTGDQCWDSPIPSAPCFNERLSLIKKQEVLSGFTVKTSR